MPQLPLNFIFSAPPAIQIGYFVASLLIALFGRDKIMGFWGYFFASILLTPLIGLLLLLVSGKRKEKEG